MQGDPSVRDEPLYATPSPEGLPGVPEGALIRLDREVYGLVSGMSGWRSRIVSQLKEEGYEMNVYEPCLFSKFAVREEPAVDGGSIVLGEFVGCVLLEVDDHLKGALGGHTMTAWRDRKQALSLRQQHDTSARQNHHRTHTDTPHPRPSSHLLSSLLPTSVFMPVED